MNGELPNIFESMLITRCMVSTEYFRSGILHQIYGRQGMRARAFGRSDQCKVRILEILSNRESQSL